MCSKFFSVTLVAFGLLLVPTNAGFAQQPSPVPVGFTLPFVSPIFGDNMVLQRNKADRIWGWSDPGDTMAPSVNHSRESLSKVENECQP
jgi:sialate O-acetylesterase